MPTIPQLAGSFISPFAGAPGAGTTETQTLTIGGAPTGGTFRLRFDGHNTAPILWTAVTVEVVAAVGAALGALPNIGAGGVVVSNVACVLGVGTVLITFALGNAVKAQPTIAVLANNMTGAAPTVAVAKTTTGVDAALLGAPKGALLTDVTNGILYINTGTATAPTWTKVGTQV